MLDLNLLNRQSMTECQKIFYLLFFPHNTLSSLTIQMYCELLTTVLLKHFVCLSPLNKLNDYKKRFTFYKLHQPPSPQKNAITLLK